MGFSTIACESASRAAFAAGWWGSVTSTASIGAAVTKDSVEFGAVLLW